MRLHFLVITSIFQYFHARTLCAVAMPSGFSIVLTNFADTGSVTAVNNTGTSVDRFDNVCAAGVAIPKTKSLFDNKFVEMV